MPSVSSHNGVELTGRAVWPARFADVRDEFIALRSTAGVYNLAARARFRLTGTDRVRWLNGMVTNNIRDLGVGEGAYAFLLNPQGHILGDLTTYHRGEYLLVETDQTQADKILATFDHFIIMDDVEVSNISETLTTVGLTGPKAQTLLRAAGFEIPELKILQVADLTWQQTPVTIVRGGGEDYPSYDVWIAPGQVDSLLKALQSAGAVPVGRDALELYRVALGIPRYGQDIRERDLPQETEQRRALNFNKGCYVGQEIVERIRSRGAVHRKFTGFKLAGPLPAPGTKIQMQAKDVGEITSSALIPVPEGDQAVALGYIRREFGAPGKQLDIAGSVATVSDLPFTDLLKTQ